MIPKLYSERSEESTAADVMPRAYAWILRCAQNDKPVVTEIRVAVRTAGGCVLSFS